MPIRTPASAAQEMFAGRLWWRDPGTLVTGAALLGVAALAWVGVVHQATTMGMAARGAMDSVAGMRGTDAMAGMAGPAGVQEPTWLLAAAIYVASWGVMMAAMMLPSAAPMIALYGAVSRNRSRSGQAVVPAALFAATYLFVWFAFGIPVYAASVLVDLTARVLPAAAALLPYGIGITLLAAGAYQFSAVKQRCLVQCQDPLSFLMHRYRSGYAHTFRLGLSHAAYCVGCCWGLMVVLVAAGAMSLHWVLLITLIVFAEKLLPGRRPATLAGVVLVVLGAAVLVSPGLAAVLRTTPVAPAAM